MKRSRENPGRFEALQHLQHALYLGHGDAELFCCFFQRYAQVAGLRQAVDQIEPDQAVAAAGKAQVKLFDQLIPQALGLSKPLFEVLEVARVGSARLGKSGQVARRAWCAIGRAEIVVGNFRVQRRVALAGQNVTGGRGRAVRGFCRGIGRAVGLVRCGALAPVAFFSRGAALISGQQWVLLDLAGHVVRQFEVRQLQQLDGLLQLRCHHQRLALADLEALADGHAKSVTN